MGELLLKKVFIGVKYRNVRNWLQEEGKFKGILIWKNLLVSVLMHDILWQIIGQRHESESGF